MNLIAKNLLLRIARRLEEQAEEGYKRVPIGADAKVHENARRRRDRELGDALDLRAFVHRHSEVVLLEQCLSHKGLPITFTASAPTVSRTVCPNCEEARNGPSA